MSSIGIYNKQKIYYEYGKRWMKMIELMITDKITTTTTIATWWTGIGFVFDQ